jgi:hypothetical protein
MLLSFTLHSEAYVLQLSVHECSIADDRVQGEQIKEFKFLC